MPLKYSTETFLLFLLGLLVLVAGFLGSVLPDLPVGSLPWGLSFLLAIAYPLALSPFLRRNRADTSFRILHFLPAAILLLWLLLQVAVSYDARLSRLLLWYRWGWTLPAVILSFLLLTLYSLRVMRSHVQRVSLLALLLVPFIAVGVSAQRLEWEPPMWASVLREVFEKGREGLALRRNLASSSDASEEAWRRKLRRMDRREERIEGKEERKGAEEIAMQGKKEEARVEVADEGKKGMKGKKDEEKVVPPPTLPSSGLGVSFLVTTLLAGYCGTLHRRALRRLSS